MSEQQTQGFRVKCLHSVNSVEAEDENGPRGTVVVYVSVKKEPNYDSSSKRVVYQS